MPLDQIKGFVFLYLPPIKRGVVYRDKPAGMQKLGYASTLLTLKAIFFKNTDFRNSPLIST